MRRDKGCHLPGNSDGLCANPDEHPNEEHATSHRQVALAIASNDAFDRDGDLIKGIQSDANDDHDLVAVTLRDYGDELYTYRLNTILVPKGSAEVTPQEVAAAIASILGHTEPADND